MLPLYLVKLQPRGPVLLKRRARTLHAMDCGLSRCRHRLRYRLFGSIQTPANAEVVPFAGCSLARQVRRHAYPLMRRASMATMALFVVVLSILIQRASGAQVRAMHLVPYLTDSPPTPQVAVKMCNVFKVVEKPYYILFGSCWICAVLQQLIDCFARLYEERQEELGFYQKCYVGTQLSFLVLETFDLMLKVGWTDGGNLWELYNLYVYIFVHSSVFVRSVMMTMITWDWYEAKLLKRPVFSKNFDGKGYTDDHRACILIVILQFGSSAFVMGVVFFTHLLPAFFLFIWVFALAAAFVIKIRGWLQLFSIDPEGRFGRGLVMASNSFVAVAALQTLLTSMVRVYLGVWSDGYFTPISDDFYSRNLHTWYECHLSEGWGAFHDQDFLNLFVR